MIALVDTPPTVEPHNGLFLLTAKSGDEIVQIALTRYALRFLEQRCKEADAKQRLADLEEPIPFKRRKRPTKK
jgi:hypothetical protein